jgi:hypothetical protein
VDQRLVRERSIDHLSHEACALSLLLVTVAEAQGVSFYADRSLCQRVSIALPVWRQARQALITCGLVAYERPLSQVFALGGESSTAPACPATDDEEVDLTAVFQQIWEVL